MKGSTFLIIGGIVVAGVVACHGGCAGRLGRARLDDVGVRVLDFRRVLVVVQDYGSHHGVCVGDRHCGTFVPNDGFERVCLSGQSCGLYHVGGFAHRQPCVRRTRHAPDLASGVGDFGVGISVRARL